VHTHGATQSNATNRGVGAAAVQAETARFEKNKNRAPYIRKERTVVSNGPSTTHKSCRSSALAIGDQISFPNSCRRLPRGKASTDDRRQMFGQLPGTGARALNNQ